MPSNARPLDQADVDAVLEARYGPDSLGDLTPAQMHAVRSDALSWLNAATALGWTPPTRPSDEPTSEVKRLRPSLAAEQQVSAGLTAERNELTAQVGQYRAWLVARVNSMTLRSRGIRRRAASDYYQAAATYGDALKHFDEITSKGCDSE